MSFAKLYGSTLSSSINDEDVATRWFWAALLMTCDRHGNVHGTVSALARLANIPVDDARVAMERLQAPDPDSTSSEEDGRRVVQVSTNEWHVVNYKRYRDLRDPDHEREQARIRQQRYRDKKRDDGVTVTEVTVGHDIVDRDADGDADRERKRGRARFRAPTLQQVTNYATEKGLTIDAERFVDFYESKGWKVGSSPMKDWKAAVRNWCRRDRTGGAVAKDGFTPWHPDDYAEHLEDWEPYYVDCKKRFGMTSKWPRFSAWVKTGACGEGR